MQPTELTYHIFSGRYPDTDVTLVLLNHPVATISRPPLTRRHNAAFWRSALLSIGTMSDRGKVRPPESRSTMLG